MIPATTSPFYSWSFSLVLHAAVVGFIALAIGKEAVTVLPEQPDFTCSWADPEPLDSFEKLPDRFGQWRMKVSHLSLLMAELEPEGKIIDTWVDVIRCPSCGIRWWEIYETHRCED
jgi:hypothetical protein